MPELRLGTRLRSVVCTAEVVLVAGSPLAGSLTCGGQPMLIGMRESWSPVSPSADPAEDRTLLGKRYRTPDGALEVLCVRQGRGELAFGGIPLGLVKPKVLPASD